MKRYSQKQLRDLVRSGAAIDITQGTNKTRSSIITEEGYLHHIGYSSGVYGCSGALFMGHNTGKLYTITARTTAIYIFT